MQKFNKGDKVRVADDLGPTMKHFQSGMDAIVIGSYKDKYGGDDTESYTIHIEGRGTCSWYYEHQLTLIEKGCYQELCDWEEKLKTKDELESDINWIFDNGKQVAQSATGYSVQTLFNCICKGSLWGSNGEGINYYENSRAIMHLARPFLENEDLTGWLKLCEEYKQ